LYGEDSRKFTRIDTEHLRERCPSGTKENSVELAVVLKEDPQAFRDCKDGVAMWDVFDNFAVNVFPTSHKATSDKLRTLLLA
jgi:hypothetical protein